MNLETLRKSLRNYSWLIIPLLLVTAIPRTFNSSNGSTNLYTYQAEAFLDGDFAIQEKPNKLPGETIEYHGHIYSPFPPFPAVLLTPFVAIFGRQELKTYWITFAMAVLTSFTLYRILLKLELDRTTINWSLTGFVLGTGYWQIFRGSEWVWPFAQLTAALFMFLAIYESTHKGRGWLAGLLLGAAFLSRQLSIIAGIFILALLWKNGGERRRTANMAGFITALGFSIALYLGFNYYRFETFGSGYELMNYALFGGPGNFLGERVSQYGVFSPAYFLFNAYHMFIQGFHIDFSGATMLEYAGLSRFGTSLLAASPFVIAAFRAKGEKLFIWSAWLSAGMILVTALFYHNNGYIQYNTQRFSLDFLPVLILLIALGFENSSDDLRAYWKGMIVYSILLNVITNYLPPV